MQNNQPNLSFAEVLSDESKPFPMKIKPPSSCYRREPAAKFSKDEILMLAAPFKCTLVGKFSHGRPKMNSLRKHFRKFGLKGSFTIGLLDPEHVLIRFQQEEDYLRCWIQGSEMIVQKFPVRIFKWTPEFRLDAEVSRAWPVWIRLEHLPIHFFVKSALFTIAATIGIPLQIDIATAKLTRPSEARICVEVDISKELPSRVWIGDDEEGFWQKVDYENRPDFCFSCHEQGHGISDCKLANSSKAQETNGVVGLGKESELPHEKLQHESLVEMKSPMHSHKNVQENLSTIEMQLEEQDEEDAQLQIDLEKETHVPKQNEKTDDKTPPVVPSSPVQPHGNLHKPQFEDVFEEIRWEKSHNKITYVQLQQNKAFLEGKTSSVTQATISDDNEEEEEDHSEST